MHRQRLAFLTIVVSAAVLTGHALGYQVAGLTTDSPHGYMGPVSSLVVPLGLAAIVLLGRSRGWANPAGGPPVRWHLLVAAQMGLYLTQELAETIQVDPRAVPHLLTNRSVLAGLVAQPLVAWLVVLALRTTQRIGSRLSPARPPLSLRNDSWSTGLADTEHPGWPSAVPSVTLGRAPPLGNVFPI